MHNAPWGGITHPYQPSQHFDYQSYSYQVIPWLNYIKQFNPYIHFIPGKDNIIAITLSWLDRLEESVLSTDKKVFDLKESVSKGMDFVNDPLLIDCFLHLSPLVVQDTNHINYQWIFDKQNETNKLVL